ncbi:MAG: hypothetical protein J5I94_14805 [Phaeodactylibacter sp.]|nr:hypothetical protein [Phaeodactylibacter sp.]
MPYRYIQLDYLDKMAGGDEEARQELLRILVDDLEKAGPKMRALWERQNHTELQWLCHHLKTTFPFVGNEQLASANRELEQHLRQGKGLFSAHLLLQQIETILPRAVRELRQELKKG